MNKIALVTCYLGETPWYFNLFLRSCSENEDVNFIFISDQQPKNKLPLNFQWIYMDKKDVENLIRLKLNLNVTLKSAYKLCDFKPAYGIIFEDYLVGYDFWGHCDIDIIFGRIRYFMTDNLLANYDVICVTKSYVTGFFTLFRNNYFVNHLYQYSKDYKKVFESEKHYCFDECNNLFHDLIKGKSILDIDSEIESMTHVVKKLQDEGKLKAYFNQFVIEGVPGKLCWNNGQLIIAEKYEVLLYHLILFKQYTYCFCKFKNNIPCKFYIEDDYFSKHSPYSIKGKIDRYYYKINKKSKIILKISKNTFLSSKKIKFNEFVNPEKFSGKYSTIYPTDKYTTEIYYKSNSFYIKFFWEKSIFPLRHIKTNCFYCSKYNLELKLKYSDEAQKLIIDGRYLFKDAPIREYKYE